MADLVNDLQWRDRAVLVTGATGLLGGWLTKQLLSLGAEVVCLVRDGNPQSLFASEGMAARCSTVVGDICDQPLVERVLGEYEVRTVFHLAAQTIVGVANRNPVSTFESNVRGTWSVLEACRRSPRVSEIVFASTDKAYGDQPVIPYTEDMPLQGRHPYDASKSAADLVAQSFATTWGVPVAITRCGNFFGGGDNNFNRLVPGVIRDLLRGTRPQIRSTGDLVRDYLYVEDGALAYLRLAEALAQGKVSAGAAFNFSMNAPMTVLEMVDLVRTAVGSDLEPEVLGTATHEIREQWLDSTRARQELDWAPTFGLEEGLSRTVAWYRDRLGAR